MLSRAARTITTARTRTPLQLHHCCQHYLGHIRMSSTVSTREWLVHIPDFPGALQKRLENRSAHLTNVKSDVDAGRVVFGGALLSEQPAEGQTPDMIGSAMLIKADTEEEVREWLRKDIYTKGGAWDIANAKIYPFRTAIRTAL